MLGAGMRLLEPYSCTVTKAAGSCNNADDLYPKF